MIKTIYFDLFFTLIIPAYEKEDNEYSILSLSVEEWEKYAENEILYRERALGAVRSEKEIIDKIVSVLPFPVSRKQKDAVLAAREKRMYAALQNISPEIIEVLAILKDKNIKIGLISNADKIDCKYWQESRLFPFFDDAVFSCDAGLLKPDRRIYELALHNLNASPEECLFVGDGGSNELYGARLAGMKTVFSEVLARKGPEKRHPIMKYADYHITLFRELLACIS